MLVEFAKAGLSDPVLIRLDVESKIPEELQLWYITVRQEEKLASLLVLLKTIIDSKQQTVVFAATKHHVEYLHMVLDKMDISNTYIYSNLDPSARKINAAKFSSGKVKVLVVTDVAARGIDIPQLDNVINFNFPAKSKLFVHRVGRCARAGRSGTAYSLVTPDEYAYLLDLHLFLGRPLTIATLNNKEGTVGRMPQSLLEEQHENLLALHTTHVDLVNMKKVSENGYMKYIKMRPAASTDSNKRIKEMPFLTCAVHPIFKEYAKRSEEERESLLDKMKNYRPQGTIFEICGKNKSQEYLAMKQARVFHKEKIVSHHESIEQKEAESLLINNNSVSTLPISSADDIDEAFQEVIVPKKRKLENLYKKQNKRLRREAKDSNFIPYFPSERHTEEGLAVNNFSNEANKVQLDLTGSLDEKRSAVQGKRWDRKKKKMVTVEDKRAGKIRTESGVWVPKTYKSNRYSQWKEKSKIGDDDDNDEGDDASASQAANLRNMTTNNRWARHNEKVKLKQRGSELKSNDEILKARTIAERKRNQQKKKRKGKGKRSRKQ